MFDGETFDAVMTGDGIAAMTRDRWGSYAHAAGMRFADTLDLPALRAARPDWRATALAPVTLVEDVWLLPSVADATLDCLIAHHALREPDRVEAAIRTAARVLRPGGTLVLAIPDERYAVAPDREAADLHAGMAAIEARLGPPGGEAESWSADRVIRLVMRLPATWFGPLEFEGAARLGGELVMLFVAGGAARYPIGTLLEFEGRVFVADGRHIRHVQNPDVLAAIGGGTACAPLGRGAFARLVIGRPMRQADVAEFLARRVGGGGGAGA